jgi:Ubiquitin family
MPSCPSSRVSDDLLLGAPIATEMRQSTRSSDAASSPAPVETTSSTEIHANVVLSTTPAEPVPNRLRIHFEEELTWEIFIRMPRGYTVSLKVHPSDLAKDVRSTISAKIGLENLEEQCIPEEFQRLLYNFRRLDDDKTLAQNRVSNNSTLDLFGRNLGQL